MSNLSDIKRRLTSVKQTRQITGAMETVSVAKMRKAVERCENCRAYRDAVSDIMYAVSDCVADVAPSSGMDALIVLSSDKGLCGAFDHDLFKLVDKQTDGNTTLFPVGQAGIDYYKTKPNVDLRFGQRYVATYKNANDIATELLTQYGNGIRTISIAYSKFSGGRTETVVEQLLPLKKNNEQKRTIPGVFEPSADSVYFALLPLYFADLIYCAILSNVAAEHGARRAAMSSATDSADMLIAKLIMDYNRVRQSSVTEQITEIIGSTSAMDDIGVVDREKS